MKARVVPAVHGLKQTVPDPSFEWDLAKFLSENYGPPGLPGVYSQFVADETPLGAVMRRAVWRAACREFGEGVTIEPGVQFKHIETFEIGDGVFIGRGAFIQGRFDGICRIGSRAWLGPYSYFDARQLLIEEDVGWGPGARLLGSEHTGLPTNVPVIRTDLVIEPVIVERGADIGTNAVLLPGVRIGSGAIVGAGAVVTRDVEPMAVVSGVPAKFMYWRDAVPTADAGTSRRS